MPLVKIVCFQATETDGKLQQLKRELKNQSWKGQKSQMLLWPESCNWCPFYSQAYFQGFAYHPAGKCQIGLSWVFKASLQGKDKDLTDILPKPYNWEEIILQK